VGGLVVCVYVCVCVWGGGGWLCVRSRVYVCASAHARSRKCARYMRERARAEARQESCEGALSGQDAAPYQTVCPRLGVGVLSAVGDTDLGALGLPQILKSQSIYSASQIEYF
jgi:hypothetical protein